MFLTGRNRIQTNETTGAILFHMLVAAVSLFANGFGVYMTIQANIGAGPWDVLNLGISATTGMLYGTASILVSCIVLLVDILMREPIGIAMIIDAIVVGKAVDFFNRLDLIPACGSWATGIPVMIAGLFIMGYTQYAYMSASLGCGPRDTLMVGLAKRVKKIPIGVVSILILAGVTLAGWLLGGPVGIGTVICAAATGPIMQLAFYTVHFDAKKIHHQHIAASLKVIRDT